MQHQLTEAPEEKKTKEKKTTKISNNDPDRLMAEPEAAEFLGVTRRALQQWRLTGAGPVFVRISQRCIRYRRRELIRFSEARLRTSTSDKGQEQ